MGARVYDPYTGTFTQPDPIQGADASNYGYANGDPVNETDLTGQAAGAVALDAGGGAETGAVLCAWAGFGDVACAAGGALVGTAAGLVSDTFGGPGGSTGSLVSLGYHQGSSGAEVSPGGVVFAKGGKQNVKQNDDAFTDENGVPLNAEQVKAIHDDPNTSTALKKKASQQLKALGAKRSTQS